MATRYSHSFRSALILGLCSFCLCGALPSHADPPLPKEFKNLTQAILKDEHVAMEGLLRRGANIDSQDKEGFTALMTNARAGETEAVRTLLTLYAHVNLKNRQRETALSLARTTQKQNKKQDRSAIICLLKQAGAK